MANTCVVASCKTRRKTDKSAAIKCFSFPKDPDVKRQWLHLCQVTHDNNRKVCIKHFKEDDFVDGLKARLMCVQPTRLKKDAVPSLFLDSETLSEESRQMQIRNQQNMLKKLKKNIISIEDPKVATNSSKGSIEYLSKLVPIAPKGQGIKRGAVLASNDRLISSKDSKPIVKWPKLTVKESLEEKKVPIPKNPNKNSLISNINTSVSNTLILDTQNKVGEQNSEFVEQKTPTQAQTNFLHQITILQHDNAIYKKEINSLLDNQTKLLARIIELEQEIDNRKKNFVDKVKEMFANVLSSNQIDNILGTKKHVWWTDYEYLQALQLLHISKQAYIYVKDNMNYPLPGIASVNKWSTKVELELSLEKNKLKNEEDKENGIYVSDDQIMVDGDQILDDYEVKLEIKTESVDGQKTEVDQEYDQDLDDENARPIYTDNIDHCDFKQEAVTSDEHKEDDDDIHTERSDQDNCKIDQEIVDQSFTVGDENEEFYEELVIDDVYSDDDNGIMLVFKTSNVEDNG